MRVEDLDYPLPEELIAQEPLSERTGSRLLSLKDGRIAHHIFSDIGKLIPPRSLVITNNTRVIPARLLGQKASGGKVELLLVRRLDDGEDASTSAWWLAMGKASKPLRVGQQLRFGELSAEIVTKKDGPFVEVALRSTKRSVSDLINVQGALPLPPYIRRPADAADGERYQTVFSKVPGAVAAPTAGLHFSAELLRELEAAGHTHHSLTLHVGPGTFVPVKVDKLADHDMHSEYYEISDDLAAAITSAKREGRAIVAVGTTVVRALEHAAREPMLAGARETNLFIYPSFEFRCVDALITNFHLPKSTLLALVMAFGGVDAVRDAYTVAVGQRYRFFSYGDAMIVYRADT